MIESLRACAAACATALRLAGNGRDVLVDLATDTTSIRTALPLLCGRPVSHHANHRRPEMSRIVRRWSLCTTALLFPLILLSPPSATAAGWATADVGTVGT